MVAMKIKGKVDGILSALQKDKLFNLIPKSYQKHSLKWWIEKYRSKDLKWKERFYYLTYIA